jgi:hypothetical protein
MIGFIPPSSINLHGVVLSDNLTFINSNRESHMHQAIVTCDLGVISQFSPQNYWVFGLCPSSGILDLFPSSGGGRHLLCWVH